MPDKSPWDMPDSYIYCPKCGAKHLLDEGMTFVEPMPRPQWDSSGTWSPYTWNDNGTAGPYRITEVVYPSEIIKVGEGV